MSVNISVVKTAQNRKIDIGNAVTENEIKTEIKVKKYWHECQHYSR